MSIDQNSGRAIYMQIVDSLVEKIILKEYDLGDRVPTVRDLASKMKVNPNTVQRAFGELETLGIIITKRTTGRVVTDDLLIIENLKKELASKYVKDFFENMQKIGIDKQEIKKYLELEKKI